jgi:pyruvate/2-oxoglutarate/acetoin dehydrogenase E1 component
MKKLIIALLLMFSSIASAQDTFILKYKRMYDCQKKENFSTYINVVFNSEIDEADIMIYGSDGNVLKYYRTDKNIQTEKTDDTGENYQIINCITSKGEKIIFLLYEDSSMKIIFSNGNALEFYEN